MNNVIVFSDEVDFTYALQYFLGNGQYTVERHSLSEIADLLPTLEGVPTIIFAYPEEIQELKGKLTNDDHNIIEVEREPFTSLKREHFFAWRCAFITCEAIKRGTLRRLRLRGK